MAGVSLSEISALLYTMLYLAVVGVILSIIYGIAELFSRDRVIKIFDGKYAFVFIGSEGFYGKIRVPPRGGGGFEVVFPPEGIENPVSLLAFLVENYHETGDRKFMEEAEELLEDFKRKGVLPKDFSLDNVRIDPWAPPSLVSRKVFSQELGNLSAILIFKHTLSKEELEERWKELRKLYHPSIFARFKRRVYNGLAYVKDKISAAVSKTTGTFIATLTPELKTGVESVEKRIVSGIGAIYDALLENSIGRLVTVEVQDIDGQVRRYQGVLREYSNNYIAVYDINFIVRLVAKFRGARPQGPPIPQLKLHGLHMSESLHLGVRELSLSDGKASFKLVNSSNEPVRVLKVVVDGSEVATSRVLFPGEGLSVSAAASSNEPAIEVTYEVCREADVIWPRAKVKVVGLGDYPPAVLRSILEMVRRR